ncbi:hypothetical protein CsSME_00039262 [Camellia sinensis var. sinensis]
MARTKPRKRKRREEKYDTEDIEQFMVEEIDGVMGKEEIENAPDEEKETENVDELAGIPIQPYDHKAQTGAIFILEKASLEVAKLGKFYQLLNSDHDKFLRSNNKNPADYRPDIAHQVLNFGVTVQILLLKGSVVLTLFAVYIWSTLVRISLNHGYQETPASQQFMFPKHCTFSFENTHIQKTLYHFHSRTPSIMIRKSWFLFFGLILLL